MKIRYMIYKFFFIIIFSFTLMFVLKKSNYCKIYSCFKINNDKKQWIAKRFENSELSNNTYKPKNQLQINVFNTTTLFVFNQLNDKRGTPSIEIGQETPNNLYSKIINNETKVWCTHFSEILALSLNNQNLPTRLIHLRNKYDLSNNDFFHTITEVYISKQNKWVMVDLTSSILYVKQNNKFLNLIEFSKAIKHLNANNPIILKMPQGTFVIQNKDELNSKLGAATKYFINIKAIYEHPKHKFGEIYLET